MRFGARALVAWLAGCLGVLAAHAAASDPKAVEVAGGVYMLPGEAGEEPNATNLGRFGNAGFIVGPSGVLVIDMGTSYRHGKALLAAIARVTDRPVKLAIVTHTRQDFLFGGTAFRERGIPIAMQTAAAELMAARCENCLKTLRQQLGDEPMEGTAMYQADRLFDDGKAIDGQALIGRKVAVLYYGHSSGPGDVAVFDERTGVLFAGGMVDRERIPDIGDSDLPGWHRALAALRALPVKVVVPGHGPVGGPTAIDDIERYLSQLEARARALIKADTPLSEAADATELPDFARWQQYDTVHRRNAAIAYLRVEREQLLK
ncbi:MAG: MBL fold metallo-hydrolase [Proteobacteria bacterium]|nr:MBL fold metallo-hydrolase [Pseudomonadota bacterium]